MKKHRKQLIVWLFNYSQRIYTSMFKNHKPWGISKDQLLQYPDHSFGKHLGVFLDINGFELIPKVERHDCYHVLCGYSTQVEDEIALQCLCFGNGKRSPYLLGAILLGILILPEYLGYYYNSYRKGRNANAFHHYDYSKLLTVSLEDFRFMIFNTSSIQNLKTRLS